MAERQTDEKTTKEKQYVSIFSGGGGKHNSLTHLCLVAFSTVTCQGGLFPI